MKDSLREQAKKQTEKVSAFYICGIVFTFATVILLALSYQLVDITFWLLLPIPAFLMVMSILYFSAFGLPWKHDRNTDWEAEEIEKEMIRLYLKKKAENPETLELEELRGLEAEALENISPRQGDGYL